jgi:two-component sensor histidine kinase
LRHRIEAMVLLHEELYAAPSAGRLDFARHVRSLASRMEMLDTTALRRVSFEVQTDAVELPLDVAQPLGMLLVELCANVLKHAYPGGSTAVARITLRRTPDGLVLAVADDGIGMPAGADSNGSPGFGWTLVRMLAERLDATIDVDRTRGTSVSVTVRNRKPLDGPVRPA